MVVGGEGAELLQGRWLHCWCFEKAEESCKHCSERLPLIRVQVAKMKLEDMPGVVIALDSPSAAAVLQSMSLPRGKLTQGVVGDASLEC